MRVSKSLRSVALAASISLAALWSAPALAAPTLLINTDGKLTGATGVVVGALGTFSVDFVDGSCDSLFSGCSPSAFAFSNMADAILASQALLDYVFVDGSLGIFDSEPSHTFGCESPFVCFAFTPYVRSGGQFLAVGAANFGSADSVGFTSPSVTADFSQVGFSSVFARWTRSPDNTVPEPGTLALLGVAGAALGWTQRRRRTFTTTQ